MQPLTRLRTIAAIAVFGLALAAVPAHATTIQDPLHGFCGTSASASTCIDNGTITPFSSLGQFGFYASPDAIAGTDWLVAILVPTGIGSGSEDFTVNELGGVGSTDKTNVAAARVGAVWSSGDLADFLSPLGLSTGNTSPANPFNAFTVMGNSGVTGFYVYVADLAAATLYKSSESSSPNAPILTLGGSTAIATGMEITSFLLGVYPGQNQPNVATAPSGVLLADCTNGDCGNHPFDNTVPEPASMLLLGTGLALIARRVRRRPRA